VCNEEGHHAREYHILQNKEVQAAIERAKSGGVATTTTSNTDSNSKKKDKGPQVEALNSEIMVVRNQQQLINVSPLMW
jgi:hypothetical protein